MGLSANQPVRHPTVFTKNRDRLLEGAVAKEFFSLIVNQVRRKRLLSDKRFTLGGTLVEASAGQKSFQAKQETVSKQPPSQDAGSNPTVDFRKQRRLNFPLPRVEVLKGLAPLLPPGRSRSRSRADGCRIHLCHLSKSRQRLTDRRRSRFACEWQFTNRLGDVE